MQDNYGRRVEAISDEDTFIVSYLSVFDSRGKLTNSVVGSWKPACKKRNARNEVHDEKETAIVIATHAITRRSAPHEKELESISRASILLYMNIGLTSNKHVCANSKKQTVRGCP
eukprot:6185992-Pleurochrysis_carterae.AAC.2